MINEVCCLGSIKLTKTSFCCHVVVFSSQVVSPNQVASQGHWNFQEIFDALEREPENQGIFTLNMQIQDELS